MTTNNESMKTLAPMLGVIGRKNAPPAKTEMRSYVMIANHPGKFDPFDPDPAGALREISAWLMSPELLTPTHATYRMAHYNQLTEMLRRAIKNAEIATKSTETMPLSIRKFVPGEPASGTADVLAETV